MPARSYVVLAALGPLTIRMLSGQAPVQPLPGSVEIGVFTRFTRFDRSLGLDNSFGVGGRLGIYVLPGIELEGAGTTMSTGGSLTADSRLTTLHARLVYSSRPVGPFALLLGGGVVHNMYGSGANVSDDGVSGILGFRLGGSTWAARVETVEDFIPSPANQSGTVANNWNFAVQAGVSVALGASRHERVSPAPAPVAPAAAPPRVDTTPHPPPPPPDADHDGVVDSVDVCLGTPAGERVDDKGCPLPKDADGDGVIDSADRCPSTPLGVRVDVATGCPFPTDADGDGVPDSMDRCAGTPKSERTDAIGCPLLFEGTQRTFVMEGVRFESGGAILTAEARTVLDRVALSLKAHREFWVEVAGYTDNVGNALANRRLSQRRAEVVRGYLIERGVPVEQLTARGYGASDPIDSNSTAVGRARNRRVELHRLS